MSGLYRFTMTDDPAVMTGSLQKKRYQCSDKILVTKANLSLAWNTTTGVVEVLSLRRFVPTTFSLLVRSRHQPIDKSLRSMSEWLNKYKKLSFNFHANFMRIAKLDICTILVNIRK